jgi:hypothetical protein
LTLDQVMAKAAEAGKAAADGADGLMWLAKISFMGARAKLIDEKSVKAVYVEYLRAANKSEYGSRVNANDDGAIKFGVSKLRAFVKFAGQKGKADDVWNLVRRSVGVINKHETTRDKGGAKRIGSRYEQVLKVVRTANKSDVGYKLTDDQILEAITPKPRDIEDPALHELEAIVKRVAAILAREGDTALPAPVTGYFAAILAEAEDQLAKYRKDFKVAPPETPEDDDDDGLDIDDPERGEDDDAVLAQLQAAA